VLERERAGVHAALRRELLPEESAALRLAVLVARPSVVLIQCLGWVWGVRFGVWGLRFRVWGVGFGPQGLGFGVQGLVFSIYCLGFSVGGEADLEAVGRVAILTRLPPLKHETVKLA
jgi:hypothetical protein